MLLAVLWIVADRLHCVRALHCRGHVIHRQLRREHPARIEDDFDFARIAGKHGDLSDTGYARERRTNDVEAVVVELSGRQTTREIEGPDRKDGRGLAIDDELEIGRKVAAKLGDAVLHHLQRDDRVRAGSKLRGDLSCASERPGPYAANARHFHDCLLERARHRQRHRARWRAA
jgi:hypothetical protein